MIYLNDELKKHFSIQSFDDWMQLEGQTFREAPGRITQRIRLNNQFYFIKKHQGVGFREIIKNLLQLRWPVISAKNEWLALARLDALHIPVPSVAAYGVKGCNPAKKRSFIVTKELPSHISLEHFCQPWLTMPPTFSLKQKIIEQVADMTRIMHDNGINHRDLYCCHFLLDLTQDRTANEVKLYLIDLHRAQIRKKIPARWQIKDLAGLYFSSKEFGLTTRDLLRFIKRYRNQTLRDIVKRETQFWTKVKHRGDQLYRKHESKCGRSHNMEKISES